MHKNNLLKYCKYLEYGIVLLLLLANTKIYRTIDTNDIPQFSDTPADNAVVIHLKTANQLQEPIDHTNLSISSEKSKTQATIYPTFTLEQPVNGQTFQNQSIIIAIITIKPLLRSGDEISWFLDTKQCQQTGTHLSLKSLSPGEHLLQASVHDANQHLLATSPTVTFYIHYAKANH